MERSGVMVQGRDGTPGSWEGWDSRRREGEVVGVCPIDLCEPGGSASGINPVTFKLSQEVTGRQWVKEEVGRG